MGKTLDFYQIYFKDEQLDKLYPFAIPHKNERCTDYFENSVIAELVPKSSSDYISVCSWRLRQKRAEGASEVILKNSKSFELTEERILSSDFDIAILTPRNHKDIAAKFCLWHPENGPAALGKFRQFIKIPETVDHAIYENHFIARREIYQDYVKNCLIPAIAFVSEEWIFSSASGYITKKSQQEIEAYQKATGKKDWPIAPFILERLFSLWSNKKGFKVINL